MILGSKELIRDMNSKLVIGMIIHDGPISRANISKKLGLTKATVSAIVQDLMNNNLVVEIGSDDTSLGRKPILLNFNRQIGCTVSIDIGVSVISCMFSDLLGENRYIKQIKSPKPELLCNTLIDLITSMRSAYHTGSYNIVGIGVGIHGVTCQNKIIFTPYYDIASIHLSKQLEDYFHVPVLLENEANLSALGERAFLGKRYTSLANISIHAGVGLGLILNGKLYVGKSGHAGELGHMIVERNGRPCPCNNHGCLEQYTSKRALLRDYQKAIANPNATWEDFIVAIRNKEASALAITDQFISYMQICINNLLTSFSPEIIIINSSLTEQFPYLISKISEGLTSKVLESVPILGSRHRDISILLGAANEVSRRFLGIKFLPFQ